MYKEMVDRFDSWFGVSESDDRIFYFFEGISLVLFVASFTIFFINFFKLLDL
jgi:hypothetical protein